ncbi:dynein axonemal heavy chain 11-like isoform X2 [Patagioenas fasciata]|uniref:dynein axonemal heavy chain 11-like isoform X2 n=1 Tax=Patagioenas fasciata TaxID=372321 RepID=UPI003A99F28F
MLHEVMQKAISAMRKTTEGLGMENRKNLQFGKLSQTPLEHVVAFIEEETFIDMLEFQKLEKLEFGETAGKILSEHVCRKNEEFLESCEVFGKKTYNPSDYNNMEFEDDYTEFKAQILDPDRCPASVLCIGFHDCSGLESMFKLLAIFGSFLQKSVIVEIFSLNYNI